MKIKIILVSIVLLLVMVFASGCIPFMEKIGLINPSNEEQLSPEKGGPPDGLVKVFIGFKEKPGKAQQAMVRGVGGKIKYTYHIVDAIAASIPEKAIVALRKNPNVKYVEPDGMVYALDAELDNSWGVDRIDAEEVWSDYTGGGVNVAIIDSGIDNNHPDLNIEDGVNFVSKPSWKDPDPNKWDDDYGHGTHVAGIVAALDNDTGVVGVAPGVYLYAVKILDRTGSGNYSDVISALQWCVEKDIQVTNNSYGSSGYPGETVEDAFSNSEAAGVLHVAAAGNNKGGVVIYPARFSSVIAVSATDEGDNLADFSSIGVEVELAAPGVDIYSTYKGGGYTTYSGTSMASPHVAGTAALVIASGITDVFGIRVELQDTAEDLGATGWDSKYGWGLVNAAEAVGATPPPSNEPPTVSITIPKDGSTFDSGAEILFEGTASDIEDGVLTASLVWTSSIDGQIGEGDSFSKILNDGTHTITAEVKDSGGETGSASIGITVGTPITKNMLVFSIVISFDEPTTAGPNKFYTARATVKIVDTDDVAVEGATVYGHWSGATSDSDSGVTGVDGKVSLQSNKVKNPSSETIFTFTVDDVTGDGWTYDEDNSVKTASKSVP